LPSQNDRTPRDKTTKLASQKAGILARRLSVLPSFGFSGFLALQLYGFMACQQYGFTESCLASFLSFWHSGLP